MSLLERCQAGETWAWEEFFRQWTPPVYRWAVLLGLSASEAEDAAQDVLATVVSRLERGIQVTWVKAWLFQITRRVVANHRRRGRFWNRLLPLPHESEPAFVHAGRPGMDLELAVRDCVNKLPPPQAEVLLLVELEGFTRQETARALGLPEGTVASRLRLARAAFQRHWTAREGRRPEELSWEST